MASCFAGTDLESRWLRRDAEEDWDPWGFQFRQVSKSFDVSARPLLGHQVSVVRSVEQFQLEWPHVAAKGKKVLAPRYLP